MTLFRELYETSLNYLLITNYFITVLCLDLARLNSEYRATLYSILFTLSEAHQLLWKKHNTRKVAYCSNYFVINIQYLLYKANQNKVAFCVLYWIERSFRPDDTTTFAVIVKQEE